MKPFLKYFILLYAFAGTGIFAQNQNTKWYFGNHVALDFMTNPPTLLNNSAMNVYEGCASIADAAGNLLFYTDGMTVWNQQHTVMANGTGLNGVGSAVQAAIIIKQPGNATIYYIFTTSASLNNIGLCYSIVDMSLAAGIGSVTVKNVPLNSGAGSERLAAVKHTNGVDFWILTQEWNTNAYKAYLLTNAGVNSTAVVSNVGSSSIGGHLRFSPNGQKVVASQPNSNTTLFDFNAATGTLSNPLVLFGVGYSSEFSPDGTKLYTVGFTTVTQWDLSSGAILSSSVTIYNGNNNGTLYTAQLAPNGKIYIAVNSTFSIHVINNPNVAGLGCNLVLFGQPVTTMNVHTNAISFSYGGLPNQIPYNPCLTFTASHTPILCAGLNTGTAAVMAVAGSSGAVTYTWTNGINTYTTPSISNLSAGSTWTAMVKDTTTCFVTQTVITIAQPPALTLNISAASPTACVNNNILLNYTVSGGATTPTCTWQGNGAGMGVTNWLATQNTGGTYIYTISAIDSLNCTANNTISVDFYAITLTVTPTQSLCPNVSATLNVSGANTYTWQPNAVISNSIIIIPTTQLTTYSVTGTGTAGCESTETTQVFVYPIPTLSFNTYSITCANLGSATVTPSGGYGTYNYTWQPTSQNSSVAVGLNPNTYTVTVHDINTNCIVDSSVTFSSLIPLTGNLNYQSALKCNSVNTGTAYFSNLNGGSGTENYLWTDGNTSYTVSNPNNLHAATWSVTVSDWLTGCQIFSVFTITQPPAVTLNVASSSQSICTGSNFTLAANASGGTGNLNYAWNGNFGNIFVTSPPVGTHIFTATVQDNNLCSASNTLEVHIVPPPSLTINLSSPSMCAQAFNGSPNTITLTPNGADSYTLITPDNVSNPPTQTGSVQISSQPPYVPTGLATATIYGSNGVCTVSTTANFSITPNPTISVNNPTPVICAGETYTYTSQGATSYTWTSETPNSTIYSYGNIAVTNPSINSVFSVVGGSLGCLSPIVSTTITVNPIPEVSVIPQPTYVCLNSAITLTAQGTSGNTYTWLPNYFPGEQLYIHATDLQTKTFTVVASLNNCTNSAVATLSVKPLPTAQTQIIKKGNCVNDSLVLKGSGGISYSWILPNGNSIAGEELRIKTTSQHFSGTYTLIVYDENSCAGTKTQSVTINPLPNGFVSAQSFTGCLPLCNEYVFVPSNQSTALMNITWNMNSKNFSGNNINYCFNETGTHSIETKLKDQNSCTNTITTNVIVYPKPNADFSFSPKEPIENLDEVQFTNTSKAAEKYTWNFSVINQTSQEKNPKIIFENTGTYVIALVAQSEKQCLDTVVKSIYVRPDFTVFVPNVFSPNGDNLNDVFIPVTRGTTQFHLQIFNRWGQVIFESNNATKGWDGTFNGEPCKVDVYVWKLTVSNSKEEKELSGTVLLER